MILSILCFIGVLFISLFSVILTIEMKQSQDIFRGDFTFLFISSTILLIFSYLMDYKFIAMSCISNILWGIFLAGKYYSKRFGR